METTEVSKTMDLGKFIERNLKEIKEMKRTTYSEEYEPHSCTTEF
jgi:hypothetical protein